MADDNQDKTPEDDKDLEASKESAAEGDSEEGEEGEDGEDGGQKKSKKKLIIIIAAVFVLLAGAGAGLYFTGMLDSLLGKGGASEEEVAEKEKPKEAVFLSIPDMIVNLRGSSKQQRYLKLRVELELTSAEDMAAVEKVAPRVIDHFQTYLRELRVRDLEGSQGIYRLRQELLSRVNTAAYPVKVEDVLFQEILIQ